MSKNKKPVKKTDKPKVDKTKQREADKAAKIEAKVAAAREAAQKRLASDHEPLQPGDEDYLVSEYDTTVANQQDKAVSKQYSRGRRQEYSDAMGEFVSGLKVSADLQALGGAEILETLPAKSGTYIALLAEQERRFGNRRLARSTSIAAAHEALAVAQFKQAAALYLKDKVTPTGYARKKPNATIKRTVTLLLSDLHLGAELSALDNPMPFRAVEEARRLEFVMRQALDYKPQYRNNSELLLLINGDIIEGLLLHDMRDGAPLTEQKVIFWTYFRQMMGYFAQQFPSVRVVCQPGNHGRDKVRHPGRATSRKWDGHEWEMYWALKEMCSGLKNVSWQIDFRALSVINVHGKFLGLTHGDTEIKLGHPDRYAERNMLQLAAINNNLIYGEKLDALAVGHFHTGRVQPGNPTIIYNPALIPPNGHARTSGYINELCGQFLWESCEGHVIGDLRFIGVGPTQDNDPLLGTLIKAFRFPNA